MCSGVARLCFGCLAAHRQDRELVAQDLVRRRKVVHPHQCLLKLQIARRARQQARGTRHRRARVGSLSRKAEAQQKTSLTFDCVGQPACPVATANSDASTRRTATIWSLLRGEEGATPVCARSVSPSSARPPAVCPVSSSCSRSLSLLLVLLGLSPLGLKFYSAAADFFACTEKSRAKVCPLKKAEEGRRPYVAPGLQSLSSCG